jgi:hypothetical protein
MRLESHILTDDGNIYNISRRLVKDAKLVGGLMILALKLAGHQVYCELNGIRDEENTLNTIYERLRVKFMAVCMIVS